LTNRKSPGHAKLARVRSVIIAMKALLLAAALAAWCALSARADDAAPDNGSAILSLRNDFPAKAGVRDDIYAACQQWFVVSTLPAAKEAVRHAEETRKKYLDELTSAKTSGVAKAEQARLQASIKWLNGPFTTYLNRWRKLSGDPESTADAAAAGDSPAPDAQAASDAAAKALAMVADIRKTEAGFISGHSGFKDDLAKLESTAQAVQDANGMPTAAQADALKSAVAAAVQRADTISTRATEKAAAKTKAKDLMARLKTL
jgi:hypothetical protein